MYIRQWRKYRRMKMETLARRASLSVGSISQIETGKQSYTRDSLEAIARALGTRPGFLLEFDPTENREYVVRLNGEPRNR